MPDKKDRSVRALRMLTTVTSLGYRGVSEITLKVIYSDPKMGLVAAEVTAINTRGETFKSWCIGTVLGWKRSKSSHLSEGNYASKIGRLSAHKVEVCPEQGKVTLFLGKETKKIFLLGELEPYPFDILEA